MSRLLLFVVLVAAAGCPGPRPITDGGTGGGSSGGSAGGGAGGSGGAVNDDQCDFGGPRNCTAGTACTLATLDDGGIAKRCIAGGCDLIDQDCDAGQKCAFLDGGRTCLPDGTLNEGQSCAGAPVGCRAGLACTFTGDGGSTCARFCRQDIDCGMPQRCYVTLVLPETQERPLVCADPPMSCDPLTQSCVSATDGCYPGSSGPGCYPAGTHAPGSTCMYSNDCGKGFACSGTGGVNSCKQLCAYPMGAPSCDAGTCTRLMSSQTVGVCL